MNRPEKAPYCPICKRHRHAPELPCWGNVAHDLRPVVFALMGRVCWICGGYATTVDHYVPRSKWGTDALDNLRPACVSCNSARGDDDNPFAPDPVTIPAGAPLSSRWRQ